MPSRRELLKLIGTLPLAAGAQTPPAAAGDVRNVREGSVIPDESYSDQPYVVITNDGNWLCVLTTGKGVEGQQGQHIVSTISKDKGKTWSALAAIEPADGPEASWVMPLKVPSGRVYVVYSYNQANLRQVKSNQPSIARRVDTMGAYMFKYSDDNGLTWSKERYEIPMRKMRIDRENFHRGEVLFFWGVGKPIVTPKYAIFGFAKVGRWGDPGTMIESQGCLLKSENILTERDPTRIRWVLLPDGDEGLRAPKGPVSDETNPTQLSDGSLYVTYRTIDGYNCHAYSRDHGHTWTPPEYACYTPGGRRIKHPRAANFVRKFSNGKYLLWFHNQGGESVHAGTEWTNMKVGYYRNRNPGWIAGGIERNGFIHWSQPEILLYDLDPLIRISYPDFIEDGGRYYITETQKEVARVHEIDRGLLEAIWSQHENRKAATKGIVLDLRGAAVKPNATAALPKLGNLAEGQGFTIDLWVRFRELTGGQTLLDTRDAQGKGIQLVTSERFSLKIILNDGKQEASWESDGGTHAGTLRVGVWQHVAVIVDGGPKIVSVVIDGEFNDGGAARQFGWGRFPANFGEFTEAATAKIGSNAFACELASLRIYDRYLLTSEAVGNFRSGR